MTAGKRAMKLFGRPTSSWNNIMSNGRFDHLPSESPNDDTAPITKTTPTAPTKAKTKPKYPGTCDASENGKVKSSSNQEEKEAENDRQRDHIFPETAINNSHSSRQIGDPQLYSCTSKTPDHDRDPPSTTTIHKWTSPDRYISGLKDSLIPIISQTQQLRHPKQRTLAQQRDH